jgi:probable rRNA maturation factor
MDGGPSRSGSRQRGAKHGTAKRGGTGRNAAPKQVSAKRAPAKPTPVKPAPAKPAGGKSAARRTVNKTAAKPPALRLALVVEDATWAQAVPAAAALARKAARRAMAQAVADGWQGSDIAHEICLVLSDNRRVRRLNRQYRGKDKPTNVLSFAALDAGSPPRDMPWHLGDVVLALGVLRQEARQQKKAIDDHLTHLVIHGVLHLLGYDHEDDAEAEEMEGLEVAALKRLGIANPYLTA